MERRLDAHKGDIEEEVVGVKQPGGNVLIYGGAGLAVAALKLSL